jgi:hypothetical protein
VRLITTARVIVALATFTALAACGATPLAPDGPESPDPGAGPPGAMMIVGGLPEAPGVVGGVGSYSLPTGGSDGPWLPAIALDGTVTARPGATLAVTTDAGAIASWTAAFGPADQAAPVPRSLAESDGSGEAAAIRLPAPPPGDWVVQVEVALGGDGGTAAWYWHVIVAP